MSGELPEKLAKYFSLTAQALQKVKQGKLNLSSEDCYLVMLDMAERYFKDAQYFEKQGKLLLAFGALNYAHGWLDAGARIGVFDVDGDSRLFTVDEKS